MFKTLPNRRVRFLYPFPIFNYLAIRRFRSSRTLPVLYSNQVKPLNCCLVLIRVRFVSAVDPLRFEVVPLGMFQSPPSHVERAWAVSRIISCFGE